MKILVADDSKTNLSLITISLQKLGHTVIAAGSGRDAVELFKQDRPDLIILDVVMEGMNGFDCARNIRAISSEDWIPIIFLSASVDDVSIAEGIEAGGDDYLTKPFSDITLAAKIQAMQRIAEMRNQLYATTQELKMLSSTDALTGLYNRLEFERRIQEKLAEADRHHLKLALFFIDLDHFKIINDSLGHHVGDLLLKEAAERLRQSLRKEDFVARLGGDEFVVILSHVDDVNAIKEVAKTIIQNLMPAFKLLGHSVRISASVGIAFYPQPGTTHVSLLQNADIAMYHAKELGRNNYQIYTEELNKKYKKKISLEHELKFAIERDELHLVYQPIYNLITKKLIGMETLLRWKHAEYGNISPNIFIPIAEETGLIMEIGNWVIKHACQQGAKWYENSLDGFKLTINISLHQLVQENFMDFISEILQKTKFPPHLLELELTETVVLAYTHQLKSVLNALDEMGISISIDDFGKRYSFLTSLKYFPIRSFKIDKVFLKDVTTDPKNEIIVKSLIALADSLNLNVIAEGVDTEKQLQFLIVNGCSMGQGFLLSKPLNAATMTHLLMKDKEALKQVMFE